MEDRKMGIAPAERELAFLGRDTGCHVSPSCLECPLRWCVHDVPFTMQRTSQRLEKARDLLGAGLDRPAIAVELGISIRSVYRILANAGGA